MKKLLTPTLISLALAAAMPAHADEREDLETLRQTTMNLIQALVQNGILTQEKADSLIAQAKRGATESVAGNAPAKVVRVPYVPQHVRDGIKEELRQEVLAQAKNEKWIAPNALPEWVNNIKWEADVRVRFQQDRFAQDNFTPQQLSQLEDPITQLANTENNRNRWRTRLRFGAEAKLGDMTTLGFRLATGSSGDPVSTNQTQGNHFSRYNIGVDKAFARLDPWDWLSVSGGRIANPFYNTDLVWDPDLNFDGVAATFKPKITENLRPFVTLGAFPIQESEATQSNSAKGKWLYGAQAGLDWKLEKTAFKFGVAYYDFDNVEGRPNVGTFVVDGADAVRQQNATAPAFRQKGNSLTQLLVSDDPTRSNTNLFGLASKFQEVNVTGSVDLGQLDPYHVILTGDYVKNLGFDREEIRRRTGRDIAPRTVGYQGMITVGYPQVRARGEWNVFGAYKYLERDAVIDAFTDSDFRLGGTDARGYILGASYGIDKNTWLSLKWLSADEIDGPPLKVDVLQLDFNARF